MTGKFDEKGWPLKPFTGPEGMLVTVAKLRDRGRRITRLELEEKPRLTGRIKIEDAPAAPGMIQHRRSANLARADGGPGNVSVPLFEPVLEKWGLEGMVLSGYEINVVDQVAIEHRQAWLVNPIFEQQ